MRFFLTHLLLTLAALSASVLASPTDRQGTRTVEARKLKQATRNGIVARGMNPLRRQGYASCGTCSDCCPGYCNLPGQVQHAVYDNMEVPTGSNLVPSTSTASSLENCIRLCCIIGQECIFARYASTLVNNNCELYYSSTTNGVYTYPTTNTPGVTTVANSVTCADNAAAAGNRACCNAPLFPLV